MVAKHYHKSKELHLRDDSLLMGYNSTMRRKLSSRGYWLIKQPNGKFRQEHVLIAEKVLGRKLQARNKFIISAK